VLPLKRNKRHARSLRRPQKRADVQRMRSHRPPRVQDSLSPGWDITNDELWKG